MSDLLRQSITSSSTTSSRPRPSTIQTPSLSYHDMDDTQHDSSSSDSSASSAVSIATVRPSSREHEASAGHWTRYFDQELFLESSTPTHRSRYHVYLTLPTDLKKGPLFICHHGAGASGMSFAMFAMQVREKLPGAGVLSLEARGHGSVVTSVSSSSLPDDVSAEEKEVVDYSLDALASDAMAMIELTRSKLGWTALPPCVLVGHSLGGAVVTTLATTHFRTFGASLIGYSVLDVVEGSAIEALAAMKSYLSSRPSVFESVEDAIQWHLRTRAIRDPRSAEASVPSLLIPMPGSGADSGVVAGKGKGKFIWRTNLATTQPWWEEWFAGMSKKFLTGRGAKQLILAGTDRLDKELMIGQMQGKFQLVVIPEAGHFVQEDVPEKTAELLLEFFRRNDRSQMVLPPKVSELLAMGKKV